jgi:hypothetical protein
MSAPLTICYITARREPHIDWFFQSLERETRNTKGAPDYDVVVVDYYAREPLRKAELGASARIPFKHTPPKPTVWQGPHRLTTKDYFAPSNARNTAICWSDSEWVAFVDDLSVLMPGWLNSVCEAMAGGYIALGSYKKVKNLKVTGPDATATYEEFDGGIDSRIKHCAKHNQAGPLVPAAGSWMFGCSFAIRVEDFLSVNGSDENCDSVGGEDYNLGIRLQNSGKKFFYDLRMLTLESEEGHWTANPFVRWDKGTSPNDKSHALLKMCQQSTWAPNYFGPGGLRALRSAVLAGAPFPITQIPEHDWFDGQPLREM